MGSYFSSPTVEAKIFVEDPPEMISYDEVITENELAKQNTKKKKKKKKEKEE